MNILVVNMQKLLPNWKTASFDEEEIHILKKLIKEISILEI